MIRTQKRACDGKLRHEHKRQALAHLLALARKGASFGRLRAYRCKSCGGWHVALCRELQRSVDRG